MRAAGASAATGLAYLVSPQCLDSHVDGGCSRRSPRPTTSAGNSSLTAAPRSRAQSAHPQVSTTTITISKLHFLASTSFVYCVRATLPLHMLAVAYLSMYLHLFRVVYHISHLHIAFGEPCASSFFFFSLFLFYFLLNPSAPLKDERA